MDECGRRMRLANKVAKRALPSLRPVPHPAGPINEAQVALNGNDSGPPIWSESIHE